MRCCRLLQGSTWYGGGALAVAAVIAWVVSGGCGGGSSAIDAGDEPGADDAGGCSAGCGAGMVCRHDNCVPGPFPCASADDCVGDTHCDPTAGECLPWGVGPGGTADDDCTREVVSGVFFPRVQCEWLGPPDGDPYPEHKNILGPPVVADFGVVGDPELSRPSVVFISYNFTDGGAASCIGNNPEYFGVVRIIDGRTCEQLAQVAEPRAIAASSLALGDLNGDQVPDIVAAAVGGGLVAWEWRAEGLVELWRSEETFAEGQCVWTGPSIHDLDDDGSPEIMFYGAVFDANGGYLSDVGLLSDTLGGGYIPVVADVDADAQPELVAGSQIYGWDADLQSWTAEVELGSSAQTAVADFGTFGADPADDYRPVLDGVAEIVAVTGGMVTVYNVAGRIIFGPMALPGGGAGGAPTIADFDGDDRVELASAGGRAYTVFDLDCKEGATTRICPTERTDGILWSQPSQDLSSNRTGSAVFDFEGDGIAEVVYADECFTRVYDGRTGDVAYSRYRTSCTWYEAPIVADTDADFGAEIVIASNSNCLISCPSVDPIFDGIRCFDESDCPGETSCRREADEDLVGRCRCRADADCGGDGFVCLDPIAGPSEQGMVCRAGHAGPSTAFGLRIVEDQLGRWVNTRSIWNQHAYAVTNVDDDGTIPKTSVWTRNWNDRTLNNFRQNAPGEGAGAGLMPDLTLRNAEFVCTETGLLELGAEVCDRGTEAVADGVSVAFYAPSDRLLCVALTERPVHPGFCTEVTCRSEELLDVEIAVKAVVDDDGTGTGRNAECRERNNAVLIEGVVCARP